MYEHLDYQADGNLADASLMDFLMPYVTEIPNISILHLETPSPLNPLGVKGVGEAGCIAVGTVIASGVEDALRPASSPLHVVLARRRLSVMVLRNFHPDATRFSAALSMIEIFRSG